MTEPNWHDFKAEEQSILKKLQDPHNNGFVTQWLLKLMLKLARSGMKDCTDLRGRWK